MVNRRISLIGERLCQKVKEHTDQQSVDQRRRSRRREASKMIFEKRGKWCWRNEEGRLLKFATEEEAKKAAGWVPPVEEILDGSEEEEEDCEEEASTDE